MMEEPDLGSSSLMASSGDELSSIQQHTSPTSALDAPTAVSTAGGLAEAPSSPRPSSSPPPPMIASPLLEPPTRPAKRAWRNRGRDPSTASNSPLDADATDGGGTGAGPRGRAMTGPSATPPSGPPPHHRASSLPASIGTKPRMTNTSLLQSGVAHATLERALLGMNGGDYRDGTPALSSGNNTGDVGTTTSHRPVQWKLGHVIDLLELRRLSSRGVPDRPPEIRTAPSTPVSVGASDLPTPSTPGSADASVPATPPLLTPNDAATQAFVHTPGGTAHRSYRPLVWRVLLGYLPPRTDLWEDALARDRRLYANLVEELFSTTCPGPHEVMAGNDGGGEKGGSGDARKERNINVVKSSSATPTPSEDVLDGGGDDDDGEKKAAEDGTSTPVENPSSAASPSTPLTPGLLSARMQQEWVRGDNIFNSPGGGGGGGSANGGADHRVRISPLCAMNAPRTRPINKPLPTAETVLEEMEGGGGGEGGGSSPTARGTTEGGSDSSDPTIAAVPPDGGEAGEGKDGGARMAERLMESLLIPDDSDDEDDHGDDIDIVTEEQGNDDDGDGDDADAGTASPTERDEGAACKDKIHIDDNNAGNGGCDGSGSDEGVELLRRTPTGVIGGGGVCNEGGRSTSTASIPALPQTPSADGTDEEENLYLLDEIRKDVIRTHPDLRFFLEPEEDLGQKRYAALERILFVWAKLNKGVRYVQGMNEIVGTLYFVLAHDSNSDWADMAETDTYFLFNALMVEMRDVFVPDLDEADTGIHGRISNMIALLSLHDPEVRCHLDEIGIDPSFYSVRWLTTLLSREFLLPDTIRLWDSMFASTHKDNFLRYVSVTMVMIIRDQLLAGDFSTCMRLLQSYPPTNLDHLLESSRALWIYESQITLACHKGGISLGQALRAIAPPPAITMAYGLVGGVAPPIREQVRQVGERSLAAARGAANEASNTVANASKSFFGNAMGYWRSGAEGRQKRQESRKQKSANM